MRLGDTITPDELYGRIASDRWPVIIDVRRAAVWDAAADVLPTTRRGNHLTLTEPDIGPAPNGVVFVCIHGHNVSQLVAARLRADGVDAAWLEGGIEGWRARGYPLAARAPDADQRFGTGTVWVTRRRPKIDRVAVPWLLRRFVDDRSRILFVAPDQVLPVAEELGAIAFDVEGAPVTHDGPRCSFDAVLDRYAIDDPVLRRLAEVVRGADTGRFDLAPEAAGLLAISLGVSSAEAHDDVMLARLFPVYDALDRAFRFAGGETHGWPPRS